VAVPGDLWPMSVLVAVGVGALSLKFIDAAARDAWTRYRTSDGPNR